jgi:hypothetical protein
MEFVLFVYVLGRHIASIFKVEAIIIQIIRNFSIIVQCHIQEQKAQRNSTYLSANPAWLRMGAVRIEFPHRIRDFWFYLCPPQVVSLLFNCSLHFLVSYDFHISDESAPLKVRCSAVIALYS